MMGQELWVQTAAGVIATAVVAAVGYFIRFLRKCRRTARSIDKKFSMVNGNVSGLRRDLRRSERKTSERFEDLEDRLDSHDERLDEHDEQFKQLIKEDNHGQDTQTAGG